MPCTYDPTPAELYASRDNQIAKLKKDLDKLTAENDKLREAIVSLGDDVDLPENVKKIIHADQVKHRKEDLKRLEKYFRDCLVLTDIKEELEDLYEKLGRVVAADPNYALESQLGFDPDSY